MEGTRRPVRTPGSESGTPPREPPPSRPALVQWSASGRTQMFLNQA